MCRYDSFLPFHLNIQHKYIKIAKLGEKKSINSLF
jgi:hypothetical protein